MLQASMNALPNNIRRAAAVFAGLAATAASLVAPDASAWQALAVFVTTSILFDVVMLLAGREPPGGHSRPGRQ
jgi:hypothetical protein